MLWREVGEVYFACLIMINFVCCNHDKLYLCETVEEYYMKLFICGFE